MGIPLSLLLQDVYLFHSVYDVLCIHFHPNFQLLFHCLVSDLGLITSLSDLQVATCEAGGEA